jgi:hypothetical protein
VTSWDQVLPPVSTPPIAEITGEIRPGDDRRFNDEIAKYMKWDLLTVALSGPGGNLLTALHIGTIIRTHGWSTAVDDGGVCDSACAYVWLAGKQRFAGKTSLIGFHAAYNGKTLQETGVGNAVLGSYLTRMGLDYGAIAYLTSAGPAQMTYLTAEAAIEYGITVIGALPSRVDVFMPDRKIAHQRLGAGLKDQSRAPGMGTGLQQQGSDRRARRE